MAFWTVSSQSMKPERGNRAEPTALSTDRLLI
jgi:hypothetical protein